MQTTDLRAGPIAPTLLKLSLPVLAGQVFNLLYNMVDTFFIALIDRSDPWLVGSTGLVFPLLIIVWAVSFGLTGGISSLVARAIGAGKTDDLDRTAESGLLIALVSSVVVLGLLYPFSQGVLRLFGGQGKLLEYANTYLLWMLPMVPFSLVGAVFTGILQGEGRTRHMMVSMIIGTVANIILDPVLMFGAGMGIAGAGLATAIGNALGTLYLVVVFVRSQGSVRIHWQVSKVSVPVMGEIVRVGLPQGLMNLLASVSFVFYNRMSADLNPVLLSSFTLYSRLEQMAMIPIWALCSGLGTLAGQAAGGQDHQRMRQVFRTGTVMGLGVSGVLLLAYVLLSRPLFGLFQEDATVLSLALAITPWMAAGSFMVIPVITANTVFAAAGFAQRSLLLTVVRIYLFNVPAAAAGAYLVGRTPQAVAIGIFLSSILSTVVSVLAIGRLFAGLSSGRLQVRGGVAGPAAAQAEAVTEAVTEAAAATAGDPSRG